MSAQVDNTHLLQFSQIEYESAHNDGRIEKVKTENLETSTATVLPISEIRKTESNKALKCDQDDGNKISARNSREKCSSLSMSRVKDVRKRKERSDSMVIRSREGRVLKARLHGRTKESRGFGKITKSRQSRCKTRKTGTFSKEGVVRMSRSGGNNKSLHTGAAARRTRPRLPRWPSLVSRMSTLLVLASIVALSLGQKPSLASSKRKDVYIAGFFPYGRHIPESRVGRGVMPSVMLAVDHINENPDVLRNYMLHMYWNDTEVSGRNFSLETLTIKKSRGTYQSHAIPPELLRRVVKHSPSLRTFTVKNTLGLSHYFYKDLQSLSKLRSLNFGVHPQFGAGDLRTITDSCTNLEEFRVFSVDSHVRDHEMARFCTKMADSLRVLKISAKEMSDDAVTSVVKCKSLSTLHMRLGKRLTDGSVVKISKLTCLKSFDLMQAWHISVDAWVRFFEGPNMRNLQVIGLSLCTHVDDSVLESIANNCKELRKLRLFGCMEVTVAGLNKIFVACKELKVINVVKIDAVSKCFPCIVSHCPGLEVLIYGPVSLMNEDFDCINMLKSCLPKLQLIDVSLHRAVTNYDSYLRCFR